MTPPSPLSVRRTVPSPPHPPGEPTPREAPVAAMQAAASCRCAVAHCPAGNPSPRPLRPSLLLPGRVSRFYGELLDSRFYYTCHSGSFLWTDSYWRVRAGADAAAVPLRVCSPPLPRARGGGDFAHLDARNGEAWRLMRSLGRIRPDYQVRSFRILVAAKRTELICRSKLYTILSWCRLQSELMPEHPNIAYV